MKNRNEKGAVIVEASIVFPVMFLVIFFLIYAGNIFLQKSHVEAIANRYAMEGAAYCADPMLSKAGSISSASGWEVYPYRAFNGAGTGDMEGTIEGKIESAVSKMGAGLFAGMKPYSCNANADYHNGIIYATFTVDVSYKIKMPIRLLGDKDPVQLDLSTHTSVPVSDTPELIRNIEMIKDYAESSEAVQNMMDKINQAVSKAKEWFSR